EPRDDAVSQREGLLVGHVEDGELGEDGPALRDAVGEGLVLRWIEMPDAGAEHGEGAAPGGEGGLVRGGVDAPGEAAHDGEAGLGELEAEAFRLIAPVVGGASRTNDP